MIRHKRLRLVCWAHAVCLSLLFVAPSSAAYLEPLVGFGGPDGWLAPGELGFLGTNHTARGLSYNPATNNVYVVDRDGGLNIRILDGDTGAQTGMLDATGISGGTFPLNMIDVADDGAIYAANLAIGANLKVYRWANEAAAPTVAFDGTVGSLDRLGDTMAVIGSGADTRIVVAGSGSDGVALLDTADGSAYTALDVSPITDVPPGGMRLGLDFIDPNTIVGQEASTASIYSADLANAAGTVDDVNQTGEAALAYDPMTAYLATVDFRNSDIRLYNAADLSLLDGTQGGFQNIANNTTAFVDNPNGVGDAAFGLGPDGSLRLYAMNTNNGIQAFTVIPEPSSLVLGIGAVAAAAIAVRRRR